MKMFKFLAVLAFVTFGIALSYSQAPEGMVLIPGGVSENVSEVDIKYNDVRIGSILKEFVFRAENGDRTGASQVNYYEFLDDIKSIKVVSGDHTWLARENNGFIQINSRLNDYPYTFRVVVLREIGKVAGLEMEEDARAIMSEKWVISPRFESYAWTLANRSPQIDQYMSALAQKYPVRY